jgi:hypothetical protein
MKKIGEMSTETYFIVTLGDLYSTDEAGPLQRELTSMQNVFVGLARKSLYRNW